MWQTFSYVFNDKNYVAKRESDNMHGYTSPQRKGSTTVVLQGRNMP